MKVSRKVPDVTKRCVATTREQYDCWYSKPTNLGAIKYKAGYWWTVDHMRFVSSRDALEYLIRIYDKTGQKVADLPEAEKRAIQVEVAKQTKAPERAGATTVTKQVTKNPQQALFDQFLTFMSSQKPRAAEKT